MHHRFGRTLVAGFQQYDGLIGVIGNVEVSVIPVFRDVKRVVKVLKSGDSDLGGQDISVRTVGHQRYDVATV